MELRQTKLDLCFSQRIKQVPRSFIRDILQVAISQEVISFAGGLPNKKYFPVKEMNECASKLLGSNSEVLQYSNTEGFIPLREFISEYYKKKGLNISPNNILITTGSQQALDLIGKTLINEGDKVILEEPSYLGAIQAFSMFSPEFVCVPLNTDGINTALFESKIMDKHPKLAYVIPNFQNPSGISYSEEVRKSVADIAIRNNLLLVEDDPYGEIRFNTKKLPEIYSFAPENTLLLGTFSKTVAPGLRVGWVVAPDEIMEKLIIAKQAADLHTDIFAQQLVYSYVSSYNIQEHLEKIQQAYYSQAKSMMEAIQYYFPQSTRYTRPEGGMFLWMTLEEGYSSMQLFERAIKKNVAFVPGFPFLIGKTDCNSLRLNYSCAEPDKITEGIKRLAGCL